MISVNWATPFGTLEIILGAITFTLLLRSGALRSYWPLLWIVMWQLPSYLLYQYMYAYHPVDEGTAYMAYFYCYWIPFAGTAACSVLLTYTIFQEALRPLKGLQSLGQIMYRWVLGISCAVMLSSAVGAKSTGALPIVQVVSELMRLSGLLVLCLLIFVGFTIRPLGLSFRSRTFGVSVGMALAMAANIVMAGQLFQLHNLHASANTAMTLIGVVSQLIWIWYFAVPEPQRKFLLLPTTSPFHQWNLVSERMGYDPGYVAIGGVAPDALSSSEREIFERIAAQDTGRATRPADVPGTSAIPAGWSSATAEASERFSRAWDFRYEEQAGDRKKPAQHAA